MSRFRLEPSRAHALHFVFGALALVFLAGTAATLSAPGTRALPDDVAVVALHAEPKSLDPHATTALNDFRVITSLYQGLVRFREGSLDIEPSLAERYSVTPDGLRYEFDLVRHERFHDGTPFDAEAVKFNFERMLDPRHPFHDTGPFPLAFFFDAVRSVRVEGRYRVVFELEEPFAPFLSNLAYPTGFMVSPAAVRRYGKFFGRHPVGTGPYRFAAWESHHRIVLESTPPRAPFSLIFRPITDEAARVAELRAGSIDLLPELSADTIAAFRKADDFVVHEQVGPHLWFVILNARVPPFDDRRVRRAFNYAVDKRALVEHVLESTASVADGPIPSAFSWARNPDLEPYPYDPERARRLIAESGGIDRELVFQVPDGGSGMLEPVQMATAIQADLARVGVSVKIERFEWNAYLSTVNAGLGDSQHMAAMAWMTNDPDTLPFLTLRSGAHPPGGFNSGYYRNRAVDALIDEAHRATSRPRRAELYRRLARLVHDDAPWLFVASSKQNAVARRNLAGFALEPSFFLSFENVFKREIF
jgi:peptide/nickel transport system substrate-binding protein